MPIPRVKVNMLSVQAAMQNVRTRLRGDAQFRALVKRDPVAALREYGIPRPVAVNIIANDVGVAASDWCICTGCCCTGCSFSSKRLFDVASLPALSNTSAWKSFARGR